MRSTPLLESRFIFQRCPHHRISILTSRRGIMPSQSTLQKMKSEDEDSVEKHCPSLCLYNIKKCIDRLPQNVSPKEQMNSVRRLFNNKALCITPEMGRAHFVIDIYKQAKESKLNLLHYIVFFPGSKIYNPLLNLLKKCPQGAAAVDSYGRTPLHHAIETTRYNMDKKSFDLLVTHSPDTVVHQAVDAKIGWDDLEEMAQVKSNALSIGHDESGLLPFMMVAEKYRYKEGLLRLNMIYGLLRFKPDVMTEYVSYTSIYKRMPADCVNTSRDERKMKRRRI